MLRSIFGAGSSNGLGASGAGAGAGGGGGIGSALTGGGTCSSLVGCGCVSAEGGVRWLGGSAADWALAPRTAKIAASAEPRTTKARGRRDGKTWVTRLYYGQSCCLSAHWPARENIIMITITNLAAEKVREISKAEGLDGQGLRLRVIGGGCAGFQYDLYFEEKPTDMDERFESNGVALFVDPLSFQYLDQTEIDYVESAHGSGFKFQNPNVTSTCGCGSSFKA